MTTQTQNSILVVGGANVDMSGRCADRLIPGDSNPGEIRSSAGGVGRNIAENLARLGMNCALLSAVGNDFGAKLIEQSCTDAGVDTEPMIHIEQASTGTYLALHNQLGALLLAISDMAIIDRLTPDFLQDRKELLSNAKTLVLDANLPQATLEWIVEHSEGATLMVDAVSASKAVRLKRILPKIDLLKVNRDEAAAILGHTADDQTLSQHLHDVGVKRILLSQGPQGASLYSKEGYLHKDAIKGENNSDTGAGDALFAGFIAAQSLLKDSAQQLEFAIACATLTLSCSETVNPQLQVSQLRKAFFSHWPSDTWIA